jgi:hypothetical protein
MAVDCAKMRELLLIKCQIATVPALKQKVDLNGLEVSRTAIRNMLGISTKQPFANVKIEGVESVLILARELYSVDLDILFGMGCAVVNLLAITCSGQGG